MVAFSGAIRIMCGDAWWPSMALCVRLRLFVFRLPRLETAGPAEIFVSLPDLVAFLRVAIDIRNVDVVAASRNGVLVTRASRGTRTPFRDRKSTRLNSSHQIISYAVFCLKKKKYFATAANYCAPLQT